MDVGKAGLPAEGLAKAVGTTPEQIERLVALGILEPTDGRFQASDVHRVRLAEALDGAGVSLDDMGRAIAAGKLSFGFVDGVFPRLPAALLGRAFADVASDAGLPMDAIQELYANYNLPSPAPEAAAREDDARIIAGRAEAYKTVRGDRETLIAASRFFGENLRRAAESQVRFFRERMVDRLLGAGMAPMEVLETLAPVSGKFQLNADELLGLLYERHLETYVLRDTLELIELAMEASGFLPERRPSPPAIAFLDMSGYTRLTESFGDEEAAELASALATLVRRASNEHGGRAVKLLGDGVMFHFPAPAGAVVCGLDLVRRAEEADLPAARMGIHVGPVVFRDGDYFGRTVNVAARITDYARPREVLVSEDVVAAVDDEGVSFEPIGPIALKGLLDPVPLYRALAPPRGNGAR